MRHTHTHCSTWRRRQGQKRHTGTQTQTQKQRERRLLWLLPSGPRRAPAQVRALRAPLLAAAQPRRAAAGRRLEAVGGVLFPRLFVRAVVCRRGKGGCPSAFRIPPWQVGSTLLPALSPCWGPPPCPALEGRASATLLPVGPRAWLPARPPSPCAALSTHIPGGPCAPAPRPPAARARDVCLSPFAPPLVKQPCAFVTSGTL